MARNDERKSFVEIVDESLAEAPDIQRSMLTAHYRTLYSLPTGNEIGTKTTVKLGTIMMAPLVFRPGKPAEISRIHETNQNEGE